MAARALYTRLPTEAELAGTGLSPADYEEEVEVWPENWPAITVFCQLKTQWKVGVVGPTGLDYAALFLLLDRHELHGDDWWQMFDDIRDCEAQALDTMQESPRQQ